MSAVVGFVPECLVRTPNGDARLGDLVVGDLVLAWSPKAGLVPRPILAVYVQPAEHLYRLVAGPCVVQGCTPGTAVMDAFEDMFRGAGSLSSLAELQTVDGSVALDDAVEFTRPGPVLHLTLQGDEGNFFVDGVLVRHIPVTP
jgi:hypothetical protein